MQREQTGSPCLVDAVAGCVHRFTSEAPEKASREREQG